MTLTGAVFYLDDDAEEFLYVVDLSGIAGVTTLVFVHDFLALIKLTGDISPMKTLLGIS